MTVIRVIFDGKVLMPQEPLSLPAQSGALVVLKQTDPSAQDLLNAAIRAYDQAADGNAEDDA